jgi:hypothetical protein
VALHGRLPAPRTIAESATKRSRRLRSVSARGDEASRSREALFLGSGGKRGGAHARCISHAMKARRPGRGCAEASPVCEQARRRAAAAAKPNQHNWVPRPDGNRRENWFCTICNADGPYTMNPMPSKDGCRVESCMKLLPLDPITKSDGIGDILSSVCFYTNECSKFL